MKYKLEGISVPEVGKVTVAVSVILDDGTVRGGGPQTFALPLPGKAAISTPEDLHKVLCALVLESQMQANAEAALVTLRGSYEPLVGKQIDASKPGTITVIEPVIPNP